MTDSIEPHPSLEVIGGATDAFLPGMKILASAYKPYPVIGWNRHLETIFAALFRNLPQVRFHRENLRVKDGGVVSLDWVSGDNLRCHSHSPTLILLPGLIGGSNDTYVRHMLVIARNNGWRVVVFNSRGCAGSPVITPQLYSASFIEDLREVVSHVNIRFPESNLYAVAWSLGANVLIQYLGQETEEIPLSGAVSLCNPFNCVMADEELQKGFNNIYDKNLANLLRKIMKKHASIFEDMGGEYNIPLAANATTVREFDEGLTRGNPDCNYGPIQKHLGSKFRGENVKNFLGNIVSDQVDPDEIKCKFKYLLLVSCQYLDSYEVNLGRDMFKSLFVFKKGPPSFAVSFGFKSVDDYYSNLCSSDSIKYVRTPLLCIQAANDPIAPYRAIPFDDIMENPNCMLIVTPQGGHLGWIAGSKAPLGALWTDSVVMDFLLHLENGNSKAYATRSNETEAKDKEGLKIGS